MPSLSPLQYSCLLRVDLHVCNSQKTLSPFVASKSESQKATSVVLTAWVQVTKAIVTSALFCKCQVKPILIAFIKLEGKDIFTSV